MLLAESLLATNAAVAANYIEDVFSTYLYTGNSTSGGTQTITNNVDLSTKGGMVWIKGRSAASNNVLFDTARGAGTTASNNQALSSNSTDSEDLGASYDFLSAFNTDGFTVTQGGTTTAARATNYNNVTYASWTFRKQAKFFDVVTYTGNGSTQAINHNLGTTPGCVIVKDYAGGSGDNWLVWHRAASSGYYLILNSTAAQSNTSAATGFGNNTTTVDPTSTQFTVGSSISGNGKTYVAYLFAHDAGGFGATGTDNVISCGSVSVASGISDAIVNLGYEPQWIFWRNASVTDNWYVFDNMRGIGSFNTANQLNPNLSDAESSIGSATYPINITSTGFSFNAGNFGWGASSDKFIYIAIRRGPMKTPTTGTSVFGLSARTGTGANATVTGGQTDDAVLIKNRGRVQGDLFAARLTGTGYLDTSSTDAEVAAGTTILQANPWDVMDGVKVGTTAYRTNATSDTFINYLFRRAPGFFDVVCYTGTGANRTVSHNLGVAPEFIIVKSRSDVLGWPVYHSGLGATQGVALNGTFATSAVIYWNDTAPTSSVFSVGAGALTNQSASTYVAYLFATVAGVSKVGSYTGTGTTKQIDCGFTGGARFVLIKRTDSTGDWYVWDSARGIVAGNDSYLLLNSTAAEVTNTDYVDTYSAGFEISSTAPAAINANGGSFIFFAVA